MRPGRIAECSYVSHRRVVEMLLYVPHRNRRLIRDRSRPRTATSTFTQLLNSDRRVEDRDVFQRCFVSVLLYVHRNHQAYQGDGEPRTATSTFTQLLPIWALTYFVEVVFFHSDLSELRHGLKMGTQDGPKRVYQDIIGIKSGRNRYKNNTLREHHRYAVEVGARSLAREYDAFTCSSQVTCLVLIDNMAFVLFSFLTFLCIHVTYSCWG